MYPDIKAAAEKVCGFIREAAENGAKIVAFSEALLPGYPSLPVELSGTMGLNGPLNAVRTLCIENKANSTIIGK